MADSLYYQIEMVEGPIRRASRPALLYYGIRELWERLPAANRYYLMVQIAAGSRSHPEVGLGTVPAKAVK